MIIIILIMITILLLLLLLIIMIMIMIVQLIPTAWTANGRGREVLNNLGKLSDVQREDQKRCRNDNDDV